MEIIRKFETLSLFRRGPSPYLYCRWSVKGSPRTQRTTKESRIEPAWTEALRLYGEAKMRARGEEPEPTLGQLVEQWVEAHTLCLSPSHVQNVERFGKLHLGGLAPLRLSQLSTALVEEARAEFLKTHVKSFANQWLAYLKLTCHWAIRRKMIRQMPFDVSKLKIKRRPKLLLPAPKTCSWLAEVDALIEHEPMIGLAIRLMMGLGLRGREAREARWEWMDFEHKTYTPGNTKGGEAWPRRIPDWLLDILRPVAKPFGPMLVTSQGDLVSAARVQRVVDAACRAAEIPRITAHRLRGTYATWLSEEGVPIQDIAKALGHKDIRTTEGYLEVDMSRVAWAQERIAARLGLGGRGNGGHPAMQDGTHSVE